MENNSYKAKFYIAIGVIILIIGGLSLVSRSLIAGPGIDNTKPSVINVSPRVS